LPEAGRGWWAESVPRGVAGLFLLTVSAALVVLLGAQVRALRAVRRDVLQPEVGMTRRLKWLGRMLYAAAIVGALAFGAHQALATMHAQDPCECTVPGQVTSQCSVCCAGSDGWCSYYLYCICL
jgi:hypothetical protein